MSFNFDDLHVGGQVRVGTGLVPAIGEGDKKINGGMHAEGPAVVGAPLTFPIAFGTLNVGPLTNTDPDVIPPFIPGGFCYGAPSNPFSLAVIGPSGFLGNVETGNDVIVGRDCLVQGNVISNCGGHILAAKKNFDIPHPVKEGWRLRHTCPEGPSNDVYFRGRITNKKEIILPSYWKKLVDWTTITVNLTPIGAHQNVIVKRMDEEKVYLQAHGGMPIDCFFHIYATRDDGERLIVEYEGESPEDYPGNNDEYSVSGYHYDKRG